MYYVYILKSLRDLRNYVGVTGDLEHRLQQHNNGLVKFTKGSEPFRLLYHEEFSSRSLAMKRERFLKTGKGREILKNILSGARH